MCPLCPLCAHYGPLSIVPIMARCALCPLCALQPALYAPLAGPLPNCQALFCLFVSFYIPWVAKWRHSLYHISHQESQSAQDLDPPTTSGLGVVSREHVLAEQLDPTDDLVEGRHALSPLPKKVNKKPFQTSFLDLGFSTAQTKTKQKTRGSGAPRRRAPRGPCLCSNPPTGSG
jgi:hypothetical protein